MEINNHCPEGYNLPCFVIVAGKATVEQDIDNQLLNMFEDESTDYSTLLPEGLKDKSKKISRMTLMWNNPDQMLYTTNKFIFAKPPTEEELTEIGNSVQSEWSGKTGEAFSRKAVMTYEEEEIFVAPWCEDQDIYTSVLPIQIPEDHYWLGSIFDSPEKMVMYEDFMNDFVVYKRLVKLCEVNKILIPEGVDSSVGLPIHKKDKNTGEILISDVVYKIFKQYQYAQNFLNTKEFEVGSPEHSVGKLMMLYPKFCEFMMHTAQMQQEGKEIYDFEGNYNKAVNDAIKYVEKRKDLFDLYENFWKF